MGTRSTSNDRSGWGSDFSIATPPCLRTSTAASSDRRTFHRPQCIPTTRILRISPIAGDFCPLRPVLCIHHLLRHLLQDPPHRHSDISDYLLLPLCCDLLHTFPHILLGGSCLLLTFILFDLVHVCNSLCLMHPFLILVRPYLLRPRPCFMLCQMLVPLHVFVEPRM